MSIGRWFLAPASSNPSNAVILLHPSSQAPTSGSRRPGSSDHETKNKTYCWILAQITASSYNLNPPAYPPSVRTELPLNVSTGNTTADNTKLGRQRGETVNSWRNTWSVIITALIWQKGKRSSQIAYGLFLVHLKPFFCRVICVNLKKLD